MLREMAPIPLEFRHLDYDAAGVGTLGVDLDQTAADVGFFTIPFKCELVFTGLGITETCAGSTPGVVKFDKRPTGGSNSGRGDGDIADFKMGTTEAGKMLYDRAGLGTILYPGQEVMVEITTQPTGGSPAGHFNPVLMVVPIPEMPFNLPGLVETA